MNAAQITFSGNLTSDPTSTVTPSGRTVTKIRIASTPRHLDQNTNKWVDGTTTFFTAEAWGQTAENIANSLVRGDRVLGFGTIRTDVFTPTSGTNAGSEQRRDIIEVDELGPSLKFNEAKSHRATRTATSEDTSTF